MEPTFNPNQLTLLNERYFLDIVNPVDGSIRKETWTELCMRVAIAIAKASTPYNDRNFEAEVKDFYEAMVNFDFIPATPILMNAGTEKQQLFSCFVTQLQDNLKSIYDELGLSAQIFSGAGGVGYDFGQLRPEGSKVAGRGISSGALSFMELYDSSCKIIKIGSGSRRGAMLAALPIDHPEILEFIKCKQNGKAFKNFNISVVITDDFMTAVKMDGDYELRSFKNNPERKTLRARKVFNALVAQAWKTGEPGVLFLDAANRYNPTPKLGKYISSNPSLRKGTLVDVVGRGLIPIENLENTIFDVYNLRGEIQPAECFLSGKDKQLFRIALENGTNLFCTKEHKWPIWNGKTYVKKMTEDLYCGDQIPSSKEGKMITISEVEMTDISEDVWDISVHDDTHCFRLEDCVTGNCGEVVGIDGSVCCLGHVNFALCVKEGKIDWAKMEQIIRLGIRFLDNCIDVNKYPHDKFKKVSLATRTIGLGFAGFADLLVQLNIRYGSSECYKLINELGSFFQETSHDESRKIMETRGNYPAFENKTPARRNASTNTIAPTGSTAMIADCSYGVEPYFALAFIKNCMDEKKLIYGNKYFEAYLATLPAEVKDEVLLFAQKHGTLHGIDKKLLPDYIIDTFVTAHDIEPRDRVKVQSIWQKYIDLSISSTVNLPEEATKEDVAAIYQLAWEYGCKGITVYRNNSRANQVLNIEKVKNTYTCELCGKITELDEGTDPSTVCVKCPCGHRSCA